MASKPASALAMSSSAVEALSEKVVTSGIVGKPQFPGNMNHRA